MEAITKIMMSIVPPLNAKYAAEIKLVSIKNLRNGDVFVPTY